MKYFVVTIKLRQSSGTKGRMVYPPNYQVEIGDYAVDHLYFNDGDVKKLLLLIPDKNSTGIARENVVEITEAEAKAISNANETRTEKITDDAKIRRLELKVARGMTLTPDEEKALDPVDKTPGFGYEETLSDRIDRLKLTG